MKHLRGLFFSMILMAVVCWYWTVPARALPTITCSTQTAIPPTECEALEALYNATAGASWSNHTNWLDYSDPCSWYGVTCTGKTVTGLSLNNNNLVGTIPANLSNLSNLVILNLSFNQLAGSIPAALGDLSSLQDLNLSYNQLAGNILADLGDLSNLTTLNLYSNQLEGSIPADLGSLSSLVNLTLASNQLTGSIPAALGDLGNLEYLYLNSNYLSGSIPAALGSLSNLKYLYLYSNQLSGSIPAALGDLGNVIYFFLNQNQLTGSIPAELGNLSNVEELNINNNQLSGSIPAELGSLSSVKLLALNINQLSGTVPAELGNLITMTEINFYNNQLEGRVPLDFIKLTNLDHFYFDTTSLCEPTDASYQTWKAGVSDYSGTSTCPVQYVRSSGVYDGYVTEKSETANVGGSYDRSAVTLSVGDTAIDQQIKGFLHYNTSGIPDDAVINKVSLRVKLSTVSGNTPFDTHGYLIVDLKAPYFGTAAGLQALDFQDTPDFSVACTLARSASGWYMCSFKADAFANINLTGFTQVMLRFQTGDNDNGIANTLNFYSGNYATANLRPILTVEYYVPAP